MAGFNELSEFDEELNNMRNDDDGEYVPLYKMVADNKIAVSKREGALWRDRLEFCRAHMQETFEGWKHILDIYRGVDKPTELMEKKRLRLDEQEKTYENLLWANTNGISRETIMKLPHIEVTSNAEQYYQIAQAYEKAINKAMSQTGNCGMNCKEKLRKVDIQAQLTNRGIWRLDWKDKVNEELVREEIKKLEAKLNECKTVEQVKDVEGKLYALNEKLDSSGFSGPQLTLVDAQHLFIDPNAQLESGLDADWMIEERTEFEHILKAKYGTKDGTVYAGDKSSVGTDEEANKEWKHQSFDDDYILGADGTKMIRNDKLATVKTFYVWDRLKKRVYLYQEGKWDYPLWVWEDPYQLDRFYPYYILSYNANTTDNNMLSEAAYYLPLVNSINKINSQVDNARDRAFNITLVDRRAKIEEKDMQNMTNGKKGFVQVGLPEGVKLTDAVMGMPTPGLENQLITNKSDIYAMIQKMSSADAITRGEEYKTNTTNGAIQQYVASKKVVIGIRVDRVMAFYCDVAKDILQLMIDRYDNADWSKIVDPQTVQVIMSARISVSDAGLTFVGDDTVEPTAASKKQECMQLAQILGQFASATPMVAVVMLKMVSRAFNEIIITDEDWMAIMNSITQQQQMQQQQMQQQQMMAQMQQQQGQAKLQGIEQQNQAKQAAAAQQQQAAQQKMIQQAANL